MWIGSEPSKTLCVCAKLLQWHLMLCDPMDCSLLDSYVHGILQARIPEWVAMPSSREIFLTILERNQCLLHLLYCRWTPPWAHPGFCFTLYLVSVSSFHNKNVFVFVEQDGE